MAAKLKDRQRRKSRQRKLREQFTNEVNLKNPTETTALQEAVTQSRASNTSYVFVHGNRVPIRNLSDEYLNEEFDRLSNENRELRRQLQHSEHLEFEMTREQLFRGLK